MFFTFPEDAHWNADRQAVEFGVEIGEYRGGCSDAYFQCGPPPSVASRPTPQMEIAEYWRAAADGGWPVLSF